MALKQRNTPRRWVGAEGVCGAAGTPAGLRAAARAVVQGSAEGVWARGRTAGPKGPLFSQSWLWGAGGVCNANAAAHTSGTLALLADAMLAQLQ